MIYNNGRGLPLDRESIERALEELKYPPDPLKIVPSAAYISDLNTINEMIESRNQGEGGTLDK